MPYAVCSVDNSGKLPAMNASRYHLERFIERMAQTLEPGARLLDAGAGDCRHARHFTQQQYEACDFAQVEGKTYGQLTYTCDLTEIPVDAESYDAILCSQVLAHLPKPDAALAEMVRVLKPGGKLWLTAPLFFEENEKPYDFHRFTRFGLTAAMQRAGLEIEQLEPLEGYAGTLAYQLAMAYYKMPTSPKALGSGAVGWMASLCVILSKPLWAVTSRLLTQADTRNKITDRGMCKNYAVIARKPIS